MGYVNSHIGGWRKAAGFVDNHMGEWRKAVEYVGIGISEAKRQPGLKAASPTSDGRIQSVM